MSTADDVCEHLKSGGYEIRGLGDGVILATHEKLPDLFITGRLYGTQLGIFYKLSPPAKSQEEALLESVNRFNSRAGVCCCAVDSELNLLIKAFVPHVYEELSFGKYLSQLFTDFSLVADEDIRLVDYFI